MELLNFDEMHLVEWKGSQLNVEILKCGAIKQIFSIKKLLKKQ